MKRKPTRTPFGRYQIPPPPFFFDWYIYSYMKYIISESQKNFLYLIRRLDDLEMVHHMVEIINEGLDMFDVCDYSFEDYLDMILKYSVNTLIYSYEDNFKGKQGIELLKTLIYDIMKKRYFKYIREKFYDKKEKC